jgi:hypothetical protein
MLVCGESRCAAIHNYIQKVVVYSKASILPQLPFHAVLVWLLREATFIGPIAIRLAVSASGLPLYSRASASPSTIVDSFHAGKDDRHCLWLRGEASKARDASAGEELDCGAIIVVVLRIHTLCMGHCRHDMIEMPDD